MANTEIRSALQRVREAEEAVTKALGQSGLTQPQRDLLDELSDALRETDNLLVAIELSKGIKALEKQSTILTALNERTQQNLNKLKKVARAVNVAAKVVDALVKAAGIFLKAGLL